MASPAPTISYLAPFKRSPQYKRTCEMFGMTVPPQDWSTRESSLANLKKMAEKREELFHKMNVMMRDPTKTPDDSYRVRVIAEIVEKIIHACQKWHFDQFGSTPTA